MRSRKRWPGGTAAGGVLIAAAMGCLWLAAPAAAAAELGPLDIAAVCRGVNGNDAAWVPQLIPPRDAYHWRCYNAQLQQARGLDPNQGCQLIYGEGAYPAVADPGDPYSWRCYR